LEIFTKIYQRPYKTGKLPNGKELKPEDQGNRKNQQFSNWKSFTDYVIKIFPELPTHLKEGNPDGVAFYIGKSQDRRAKKESISTIEMMILDFDEEKKQQGISNETYQKILSKLKESNWNYLIISSISHPKVYREFKRYKIRIFLPLEQTKIRSTENPDAQQLTNWINNYKKMVDYYNQEFFFGLNDPAGDQINHGWHGRRSYPKEKSEHFFEIF